MPTTSTGTTSATTTTATTTTASFPAPAGAPASPAAPARTTRLAIGPWLDPVIDTVGHDPRSGYVERFWLGVLGPSTVLLFRRLALAFDSAPDGFEVDLSEIAAGLGLSGKDRRDGSRSPVEKALQRSCNFGVARRLDPTSFQVRKRFPPLTRRQLEHLPKSIQREHRQWLEGDARRPAAAEMRRRARRLALALVELGEPFDGAERQLHGWMFHPAIAHDAVQWAHAAHLELAAGGRASNEPPAPTTPTTPTTPNLVAAPTLRHGHPVISRLAAPSASPPIDAA